MNPMKAARPPKPVTTAVAKATVDKYAAKVVPKPAPKLAPVSSLKIQSSSDFVEKRWTVLSYGDNRAGKTFFAGTWPHPVFLVHELVSSEMRTVAEWDMPVVTYGSPDDAVAKAAQLSRAIKRGEAVGPWKPKTIVLDNMTATLMAWEEELGGSTLGQKLGYDGWRYIKSAVTKMMRAVYDTPCNVIWICHTKVITTRRKLGNEVIEEEAGGLTLDGAAKTLVPGNCDLLLYHEVIDRGPRGNGYIIHLRKHGIWPAGLRSSGDRPIPGQLGPEPSPRYDDLAAVLGMPLRADVEKE